MRRHPESLRAELSAHLRDASSLRESVESALADPSVASDVLLEKTRTVARLASREAALARRLLRSLGEDTRAPEARPLRERVLNLLEETGVSARAGLLAAHLEVREGVPADVRRFGALRRYEAQARPRQRSTQRALITPALDSDGCVYGAFMTASRWPLRQRVIISDDHALLLEIQELMLVLQEHERRDVSLSHESMARLAHHAERLLDASRPRSEADTPDWRTEVSDRGKLAVGILQAQLKLEKTLPKTVSRLADILSPHEQLWGREA